MNRSYCNHFWKDVLIEDQINGDNLKRKVMAFWCPTCGSFKDVNWEDYGYEGQEANTVYSDPALEGRP